MKNKMQPHPNRAPFKGVLTLLGVPSDKAPAGAREHRVLLPAKVAREALGTLIGMGVCVKEGFDGHSMLKIGVITHASISGGRVRVKGHLYARDFKETIAAIRASADLGMSYEISNAHVKDFRAKVWTLERVTFTGAAILRRSLAAYTNTSFTLGDTNVE